MYYMVKVQDTVRIPPNMFDKDFDEIMERRVHDTFEGKMRSGYGVVVLATDVESVGEGVIVHGDGAVYQKVTFDALVFKPEMQEVVECVVCEVVEFGAFCHIGAMDALVHMSQIMNDYIEVDLDNERLTGRENKRSLTVGTTAVARVVSVSVNEVSPRESKIGLTMRQPALGAHDWIKERREDKKEGKSKGSKKTEKAGKKKKGGKKSSSKKEEKKEKKGKKKGKK